MTRWRIRSTAAAALTVAVTAALAMTVAPPASAASGSWTINLGCKPGDSQPIDIVVVEYSFDGLTASASGYVAGRHTYGAGPNDYAQVTSNLTADATGHTENVVELSKSSLTSASYTPTPGDEFQWRVFLNGEGDVLTGSAILGGSDCSGSGSTITAGTPTVSGTAQVGQVLTAVPGSWTPTDVSFSYQWLADGTAIPGATGPSITLTSTHLGRGISVQVTGSKTGYTAATVTSAATSDVAPGTLAPTPKPKIKGTVEVGEKLTAKPGTWGPGTVAKSYKWFANGKAIAGATGKKLTLKAAQLGKRITVKVTGKKAGYTTVTKTSAPTAKVTS